MKEQNWGGEGDHRTHKEERSRLSGLGGTGTAKTACSRDLRSVHRVLDRSLDPPRGPDRTGV